MPNTRLRCECCGRFIGYRDAQATTYTPFAGSFNFDPPDPVYLCGKCTNKLTQSERKYLLEEVWIPLGAVFKEKD